MSTRLLMIHQGVDDPATRYRLGMFEPLLAERGVHCEQVAWPKSHPPRWPIIERARDYDGVVVFRRLMRLDHLRALRRSAKRLAFDFDDCVTRRDSSLGIPFPLIDKVIQFRAMIRSADAITAGNEYLHALADRHRPRGPIVTVPTTIDLGRYPLGQRRRRAEGTALAIGWIGQKSTWAYLARLRPALVELRRRWPGLMIRCIGDAGARLEGLPLDVRPWSRETEVDDLQSLDIGLAPLADDNWTRGKCGLRLLQYAAAGVPAVASPVGVQGAITQAGGAVPARTESDWVEAVDRLLRDPEERARIGRAGRELVTIGFTPTIWIDAVIRAWCGTSTARPSARIAQSA